MRSVAIALSAFTAVLSGAAALPSGEPSIPENYTFEPAKWEVQAFPDGPDIHLEGTIQQVRAELVKLNPNYDADFNITLPEHPEPTGEEEEASEASPALEARTDFNGRALICNKPSICRGSAIWDGVHYLKSIGGKPRLGAGPGRCSRVSCSDNSAIVWCNDNRSDKELFSFGSIADGAMYILDKCGYGIKHTVFWSVGGQVFHETNWNVYVAQDKC